MLKPEMKAALKAETKAVIIPETNTDIKAEIKEEIIAVQYKGKFISRKDIKRPYNYTNIKQVTL